jgi:hypothetical protein
MGRSIFTINKFRHSPELGIFWAMVLSTTFINLKRLAKQDFAYCFFAVTMCYFDGILFFAGNEV